MQSNVGHNQTSILPIPRRTLLQRYSSAGPSSYTIRSDASAYLSTPTWFTLTSQLATIHGSLSGTPNVRFKLSKVLFLDFYLHLGLHQLLARNRRILLLVKPRTRIQKKFQISLSAVVSYSSPPWHGTHNKWISRFWTRTHVRNIPNSQNGRSITQHRFLSYFL